MRVESDENAIYVYDAEKQIYEFKLVRLFEYWSDGLKYGIEDGYAEVYDDKPYYLFVSLTTASNQSGIVAVIDMEGDTIAHINNGAFAIKSILLNESVITLFGEYYYGCPYHNFIGITPFRTVDIDSVGSKSELGSEYCFGVDKDNMPTHDIVFTSYGDNLIITDSKGGKCQIDISNLLNNKTPEL